MKSKKHLMLFSILAIIFVTSSCKKDDNDIIIDENATGTGSFTYLGESYSTSIFDAVIYDEYSNDDYTGYDLTFSSPEMVLIKEDNWHSGDGNMITLSVISDSPTELISGTYLWDEANIYAQASSIIPDLFYYGHVYIHSKNLEIDITEGSLTIQRDGTNFTISYSVELLGGDIITGSYSGGYNHYNGNY